MFQREFERIPVNIQVKYFNGITEHFGTITNLTEKGMFIRTRVSFPMKPRLRIIIPLEKDILRVSACIRSFGLSRNSYSGLGVEILDPRQNYLDFVGGLRSATKMPA
ncbi:MAG TPA: PilZ domain-containing protein [Nitrospirae bacterium]|nr:PilZ domain protein [bacterium BMS3Abin10]GBE39445.1 PilZ domain protein [bacterium BMS3Bbin08]HDH00553.1 PilZ domain-containing protein [Nitrospirota bacterium]HDH50578.1 PilZ domain-containing protein [Nitrospirota bacterium]HDK81396.1 PilZ domain-containing protein [Nitrospirota bacterium]